MLNLPGRPINSRAYRRGARRAPVGKCIGLNDPRAAQCGSRFGAARADAIDFVYISAMGIERVGERMDTCGCL